MGGAAAGKTLLVDLMAETESTVVEQVGRIDIRDGPAAVRTTPRSGRLLPASGADQIEGV